MADKPLTKTQILTQIAEETDLSKKQVQAVFDSMTGLIESSVAKKGPGAFTVPGLCKIHVRVKAARPAQKNVWMPMLQAYKDLEAKPATRVVKVTPLKKLKDMA
ncbi:MAG: HU family DNA-binding protein [Planctomycetes bacterium]|nr:HU family DNA-binding protein [Planctomycetota bacterium]